MALVYIEDLDKWLKMVKQEEKFKVWCESKGYFPHSKYFEAWMAALEQYEEKE